MATRELRIPVIVTPDTDGGRLQRELVILARYDQDAGKLEPVNDGGGCLLLHLRDSAGEPLAIGCAVMLLGGIWLGGDQLLSEGLKTYLSALVDDVLRDEQDDEARYGRQVSSF